jgi:hypothetical protein
MKYYVIEIQRDKEGVESKGMYSYGTRDEAVAVFHQKMASGITAGTQGNLSYVLNMVINEYGNTEMMERWTAPVEPEEE